MSNEVVCYVVVKQLPSLIESPGKLAAQVHHAGSQMMNILKSNKIYNNAIYNWTKGNLEGVGTTIVLKASPEEFEFYWRRIYENEKLLNFICAKYEDTNFYFSLNSKQSFYESRQSITIETNFWALGSKIDLKRLLSGLELW